MLGDDLDHAVRQGAGREKAKILGATHQINEAGMVDQIDGAFGGPLQHLGRLVAGYLRGRRPRSGNPPLVLVTNVTLLKIGCRFLDMIILQTEPSYSWPLGQRYGLQKSFDHFRDLFGLQFLARPARPDSSRPRSLRGRC